MAGRDPKWTPDTEEPPVDAPKNRDQLVQENRQRRVDEPAAAPRETDAESGRRDANGAEGPVPREEPANTRLVAGGDSDREVRAGPGDAGASDTPRRGTEPARSPRARGGQMLMWIGVGLAVILIVLAIGLP